MLESILIFWFVIVPFTIITILWGMKVYKKRFYHEEDWTASFFNIWWMRVSISVFIVSEILYTFKGLKSNWIHKTSSFLAFLSFISFVLWFGYNYFNGVRSRKRRRIIKNNIKI